MKKTTDLSALQEEIKRLEIEQEANKAMQKKIMDKLHEQGIDTIDQARNEADNLKAEIAKLREGINANMETLRAMLDEYRGSE